MIENSEGEPITPGSVSTSVRATRDPSSGVRITQQVREAITDLGGLALAGYLASKGVITGLQALYFAVLLLLPSPVLVRIAKIIAARGSSSGAGLAVALLSLSSTWVHTKMYAVGGAGVLLLASCLAGCHRLPSTDGCGASAVRCSPQGVSQLCDRQGRRTRTSASTEGSSVTANRATRRRMAIALEGGLKGVVSTEAGTWMIEASKKRGVLS